MPSFQHNSSLPFPELEAYTSQNCNYFLSFIWRSERGSALGTRLGFLHVGDMCFQQDLLMAAFGAYADASGLLADSLRSLKDK